MSYLPNRRHISKRCLFNKNNVNTYR
jgi:hypothetical protein